MAIIIIIIISIPTVIITCFVRNFYELIILYMTKRSGTRGGFRLFFVGGRFSIAIATRHKSLRRQCPRPHAVTIVSRGKRNNYTTRPAVAIGDRKPYRVCTRRTIKYGSSSYDDFFESFQTGIYGLPHGSAKPYRPSRITRHRVTSSLLPRALRTNCPSGLLVGCVSVEFGTFRKQG